MTEDNMVEWHHRLDRHEFEQALGVGEGQGSLACCSPWGHKELDKLYPNNNFITAISSFFRPPRLLTNTNILIKLSGSFTKRWKCFLHDSQSCFVCFLHHPNHMLALLTVICALLLCPRTE